MTNIRTYLNALTYLAAMDVKKLFSQVLAEIKPDIPLRKNALMSVNAFLSALNKRLKNAKAVLGGSFAKDTWLKGDHDVDVFVVFDKADSIALEKALRPWHPEVVHGSRDYFQVKNGITYEIIPVQKVPENTTDYSIAHVAWVNKKGFKDDIILAKKFCKSVGVYGAESYIRGFSGHVIDILTIHYKGFMNFLRASSKWKDKTVIDTNKFHKGRALQVMNTSKTSCPLVVVDPLQKGRNAAAALSVENYSLFIKSAKLFLKHPNISFFQDKKVNTELLKKKGHVVFVKAVPLLGKTDVELTRVAKVFEYLRKNTEEFIIVEWFIDWHGVTLWLVYKTKSINKKTLEGPPVSLKDHVKAFCKSRKTFVKHGRVYAEVENKYKTPFEAVKHLLKENYVSQRVSSIKCGKP